MEGIKMSDYVAVIDVTKCVDCRSCVIQCKDEYALNDYPPYSTGMPFRGQKWIRVEPLERGRFPKTKFDSIPILCMQCDNPPCMAAATGGAIYKRPDGIVIIDPVKSKGQKQIVDSCPYGVIFWNDEREIPQKCTFCVHRLEKGQIPRCMQACPADAIRIGELPQIMKDAERGDPVPLHPEYGTQNRVYYIGLPKTFIAGALVDSKGECLEGADVTAKDTATGAIVANTRSNLFGDFWLDGLDVKKTYEVAITSAGKTKTVSVSLDTDADLGDIQF
jgi:Fe-S-cluster-containing dehydrogenase component